jgi:hypothetical protein
MNLMKSILRNVTKAFLVLVVIFQSLQSKGQCTTGGSLGTFTPLITWQTFGVSAGSPAYRSFNAIAGVTYTFSYCQGGGSYGGDPYLTVSNAAPTALTFNDDFCSLGSQIIWTCPSNGGYRLYLSGCCPCSNAPSATLAYRGSSNPFPPAPNDDCVNAATVSVPGTAVGTTTNAATETITIPTCGTATLSEPGVWYTVVGNGNKYGADLCAATGWDSKIFVYSGSCGALTCVTSNDNNGPLCSGTAASATWCSVPTVTYYILVTGNTTSSAFTLATTETVTGAPPTISITASSPSICPGFPATFTASGAGTYSWSTGSTSPTLAITPTAVTVYTVTGWSAATCGQDTKTVTFGFNPIPTLSVTASTTSLCSGNSATLLASGANTYTWTGGAVPVTNGSAFFPPTSATYTVIGTSALGCTNSAQSSISVVLTPSAQPTAAPSLICIGACSSLNATGATSYTWLPGNLNSAGAAVCPTTTTTYTLIKSNANCVDTKTITVIVNQLPSVFALATPSLVCASKPSVISGGGATTFSWQPGNLTGANVTVTPASNTVYTVTASDGTCVNTTTLALNTKPNPTISIVPSSTAICFGQQATLTANGGDTYTWTPSTLSGTTVLVSPPTSTLFTVVGENSVNCTHTVTQVMVVNPNPTVTTVANRTLVCAGGSSTLSAGGAHAYLWNTGSTSSLNVVSPLAYIGLHRYRNLYHHGM